MDYLVLVNIFPALLFASLDNSEEEIPDPCFDEDGNEAECWQVALDKAKKEKEEERAEELEELKVANGGYLWEC